MLKTCLVFWKSEPQCAYKRYAYGKNMYFISMLLYVKFNIIYVELSIILD